MEKLSEDPKEAFRQYMDPAAWTDDGQGTVRRRHANGTGFRIVHDGSPPRPWLAEVWMEGTLRWDRSPSSFATPEEAKQAAWRHYQKQLQETLSDIDVDNSAKQTMWG